MTERKPERREKIPYSAPQVETLGTVSELTLMPSSLKDKPKK